QVILTRTGETYARQVQQALARIAEATAAVIGSDERTIRLKMPPTFAVRWFVPRLGSLHARFPEMAVQVTTSHDPVDFGADDVHAAVTYGPALGDGMAGERLFREVLIPVCSPALALPRPVPGARELADQTLLHSLRRPDDWPRWFAAAGAPGIELKRTLVLENSSLTYQGAIDGLGLALAQVAFVADELRSGQLSCPLPVTVERDSGYFMAYPKERAQQRRIRLLHEWIAAEAALTRQARPRDRL
ncbi:MAG: hypothetical protein JNK11_04455, partial [Alphaproteobacteria bacterium]|nr:hypothetical protein [Alphaproteobacteria bacterium]